MTPYDVVIVGAGTAGSIIARRLADAGRRTLIVEAGGDNRREEIQDVGRLNQLWHSDTDWDFFTVPQEHAAGRRLHLPRGRVLGGSHSLNAAIWVRGNSADFDGWEVPGWTWADVEPIYRRIEQWHGPASEGRGTDGPLPIEENQPMHPVQEAIIAAAEAEGLPRNPDYNGATQDGVSREQVTIADGDRVTTWDAYARPAVEAGRLEVRTGVRVVRVVFDGEVARGIELDDGTVIAADEVVLTAGALGSPELLLRSGVGPAAQLEALGIPVVADLPVGENLHDHYLVPVIFDTQREVEAPAPHRSVTQSHWFWRSTPDLPVPDTQPICFSVPMLAEGMDPIPWGFSLMAGIVSTRSRGRLTLASSDPADGLLIDPAVFADERDMGSMVASVQQCRRVGVQAPLADEWGAREVHPGPSVSGEELEQYIREQVITYHHQVGTCRMGAGADAVVDPTLRVRGLRGLTVADASVMPTITTGNTNAPTAVIGEKAAEFLLGATG
ncbi:GMC family oxidoreductase [Microbacterium gorillae]|uniref:GMC family oxidoreductase n=1 Tax=Microbacterium gorillae TaxID=1231063 RepID=UPI00058CC3B3|nr:GMC family oxidoreductase N-terminal domain-containing protein [Microbacterium gorillae]